MSNRKRFKGTVSISRWTGSGDTGITISLVDDSSGCECAEIHLTVEALGMAITCGSHQDCEFEWRPTNVGKKAEYKTEIIPFKFSDKNEGNIAAALKPFEVDGWKGNPRDLTNHHNSSGENKQSVGFTRYVEQS